VAIFHMDIKIITKSKGKSAVASSAYISGESIKNEYDGITHNYTRKKGVVHSEVMLPSHAPREYLNRSILWNSVEKVEKSCSAQLSRTFEMSLPRELTFEQNKAHAIEYARHNFVDHGMCADLCIHDKGDGNPHAHVMLTMRPINDDGTWGDKQKKEYILDETGNKIYDKVKRQYKCKSIKTIDWNGRDKAEEWREAWASLLNSKLAQHGFTETVDHRSYARQGIDQIPTIHMGVAAMQMERRGIVTERGNINREIAVTNSQIRQIIARANKVKAWLDENKANTPPSLYEVLGSILNPNEERSLYKKIADLKLAAKTLVFIQENGIKDLVSLSDKVDVIRHDCNDTRERRRKVERRIKTLDEHIKHGNDFNKYRKVRVAYDKLYAEYEAISRGTGMFAKSKAQKALDTANAYYDTHRSEITLYDASEKYLRDVLQKRFDINKQPPIKTWRMERDICARELGGINTEYDIYKNDVENAEVIKRFAVNLMLPDDEAEERKKIKTMEVSL